MQPWIKALRNLAWLTQLGLSVAAPPVLCIAGACWLRNRFSLGGWIVAAGVLLGVGGAVSRPLDVTEKDAAPGRRRGSGTAFLVQRPSLSCKGSGLACFITKRRSARSCGYWRAEAAGVALMLGVYGLIGRFSRQVLLGALIGGALAMLNFLLLSVTVSRAADRAETTGEAVKARVSVQVMALVRLLLLAVLYILILKSGACDPIAAILPLLFLQLSIVLTEFFRKDKGDGAKS